MQTVGSGWLMTSLAPSPFVVSLLQVMTSLSIFLLAFPAGALADIVDRRKLFLATQYFSLAVAITLSLLTFGGITTSSILVVFTLLLGLGNAMSLPVNVVIQTELVPKKIALAAMTVISFQHDIAILFVGIFTIGTSLIIITSSLNFIAYNSVSSWVRTRVVSVHQMMYWGGVAFGSIIWGVVAEVWGIPIALIAAAVGLIVGLVTSTRHKLKPLTDVDLTPSMHWYMPRTMIDIDDHAEGSVLVEMEFQIDPARSQEFESAMNDVRSVILRDGATSWELFHDVENPSRYVMMFTSESWTEHLRQHERMTKSDLAIEQHAISFHVGKSPPRISHLISEDMSKQKHLVKNKDRD
jgi:quinol monooxygenase YgiN